MQNSYIRLQDLEVYKLSRELSKISWEIYDRLDWDRKKVIGDQFIRAVDSIGANIAEGYGRFSFNDRIRFYHISRGSLLESRHWMELLSERNLVSKDASEALNKLSNNLGIGLNIFIKTVKQESYK